MSLTRDQKIVRDYKKALVELDRSECEFCGWRSPIANEHMGKQLTSILILHHIIPVAAGGYDGKDNLILLCPNHAAIADSLQVVKDGVLIEAPETREELLEELSAIEGKSSWEIEFIDWCGCGRAKLQTNQYCNSCNRRIGLTGYYERRRLYRFGLSCEDQDDE